MVSIMRSMSDLEQTDVDLDLHLSDSDVEDVLSKIDETRTSPSSKREDEIVLTVDVETKGDDTTKEGWQQPPVEEKEDDLKLEVDTEQTESSRTEKEDVVDAPQEEKSPKEPEVDTNSADHDESDLLLVMEEKSTETDDTEFNKNVIDEEHAPSSSPTEEMDKVDESITNEISASPPGATCADELLDIGDNIVEGGDDGKKEEENEESEKQEEELEKNEEETQNDDEPEEIISTPDISSMQMLAPDGDMEAMTHQDSNKENETHSVRLVSRKRQFDSWSVREGAKKLKMDESVSLRSIMLDKELKSFTHRQLEVLVLQKICEALVYKSEVAELRKAIQDKEAMVDSLRKEVVALSKQAKDMKLVNEKLVHDLARFKATSERPLLVPRITRSVGLQAVTRDYHQKNGVGGFKSATVNLPPLAPRPSPRKSGAALKSKATPVVDVPKGPPLQKMLLPKQGASLTPIQLGAGAPVVKTGKSCVIDLTSDEDRKQGPGQKFVLVNGQGMLVKMGTAPNNMLAHSSPMTMITSPPPCQTSVLKCANTTITPNTTPKLAPPGRRMVVHKKKHPAPFPPPPPPIAIAKSSSKAAPPRPELKLSKTPCGKGIVLSWKMPYRLELFEDIASYQLFAYQETKAEPSTENWGKIGDVKALPLPMAVTLTQFAIGNRYYFAVRAVDVLTRIGEFSDYQTISL